MDTAECKDQQEDTAEGKDQQVDTAEGKDQQLDTAEGKDQQVDTAEDKDQQEVQQKIGERSTGGTAEDRGQVNRRNSRG